MGNKRKMKKQRKVERKVKMLCKIEDGWLVFLEAYVAKPHIYQSIKNDSMLCRLKFRMDSIVSIGSSRIQVYHIGEKEINYVYVTINGTDFYLKNKSVSKLEETVLFIDRFSIISPPKYEESVKKV